MVHDCRMRVAENTCAMPLFMGPGYSASPFSIVFSSRTFRGEGSCSSNGLVTHHPSRPDAAPNPAPPSMQREDEEEQEQKNKNNSNNNNTVFVFGFLSVVGFSVVWTGGCCAAGRRLRRVLFPDFSFRKTKCVIE